MTTYSDMYTRIGDEIQDASLTGQVQNAIQDAIGSYERQRFYFNQTTAVFQTVAGQEYYTVNDFADIPLLIEIDSLLFTIMGVKSQLQAQDYRLMDRAQSGAWFGPPRAYSYYGERLRIFPIPDGPYVLTMSYHHRLTPLVAPTDTNAWMTDAERLIRQTAKAYLAIDVLQEPNIAQGAQMLADMALNRLQMETRKRRSNGVLKTDLPVTAYMGDLLLIYGNASGGGPMPPAGGLVLAPVMPTRDMPIPGSAQLLSTDAYVVVHNSGPAFSLVPPPSPAVNQTIWIKDGDGTAGSNPISLAGTVDGIVNPVLIDVAYGDVTLLFQGGIIRRKTA